MKESIPEGCPYSGSNERAYQMVHNIGPIFTDYIHTMVQNEHEAYRYVRIESDNLSDVTLLNFATGLSYYFQSKEFTGDEDSVFGLKADVREVRDRSFKYLEEPHEGNFVRYGIRDSLEFASVFIGATATSVSEVLKQNEFNVKPEELLYRPDFHALMNQFALADFDFYKQGLVTYPNNVSKDMAQLLLPKMFYPEQDFAELLTINEDGTVSLSSDVRKSLSEKIRSRNSSNYQVDTAALLTPDRRFSTAGCPVAHMKSDKNAIATFCAYLAGQYEKFRSKAEAGMLHNLGRISMTGNPIRAVIPEELTRPAPKRLNF